MINVVIEEVFNNDDVYFLLGIKKIITEVFSKKYCRHVTFHYGLDMQKVASADIIIMSMYKGREHMCIPSLKHTGQTLLLGLYSHDNIPSLSSSCYDQMKLISRKTSVPNFTKYLIKQWGKSIRLKEEKGFKNRKLQSFINKCTYCKCKSIPPQQSEVIELYIAGMDIPYIAKTLNVNVRTAYYHKYTFMKNFNLDSTKDLFDFIRMECLHTNDCTTKNKSML